MRKIVSIAMCVVAAALVVGSCTKRPNPGAGPDPGPDQEAKHRVKVEFFNVVGSSSLSLNNQWYRNSHGDSFTVSKFNYYISNIELSGNGRYVEPESYHLVQQSVPGSLSFVMDSVPKGGYNTITLTIGVDSLRNVSGAQTGALDPANDMFWTWSTGYIMLKLEGKSPKSTLPDSAIVFHAGGFSGKYATQRRVTLSLPHLMEVNAAGEYHIHINADVLQLFRSPTEFDFSVMPSVQSIGKDAKALADNYANMLTVTAAGL